MEDQRHQPQPSAENCPEEIGEIAVGDGKEKHGLAKADQRARETILDCGRGVSATLNLKQLAVQFKQAYRASRIPFPDAGNRNRDHGKARLEIVVSDESNCARSRDMRSLMSKLL